MVGIPEFTHGRATVAAANALILSAMRQLNDAKHKKDTAISAVAPLFALEFSNKVIAELERDRLGRFYNRLKTSRLPKAALRQLIDHIKFDPLREATCVPFQFEEWRKLIYRFDLTDSLQLQEWIPVLNGLAAHLIRTPQHLALLKWPEISGLAVTFPAEQPLCLLWQAACIQLGGEGPSASGMDSFTSPAQLASSFRGKQINQTMIAKKRDSSVKMLGLSAEFEKLGPAAKIRKLAESPHPMAVVSNFLRSGAQLNMLRQVQDSLSSVAAGIQCYGAFCDLLEVQYFPPSADVVLQWSAVFSPGRTFGMYVSHLDKACQLLGFSSDWRSSAVTGAIKGLANAMDLSLKFDNYMNLTLFRRVITAETLSTDFGKFMYLSFLFVLRGPSEALPAQRAPLTTKLDSKILQAEKALLGLRKLADGSIRLILKLNKRKNFRGSVPLMRPCFCGSQHFVSNGLCPVHDFWPLVAHLAPKAFIMPSLQKSNLNRILKAILTKLNVEEAARYSTHCFRRGAAMELLNLGTTLAVIMKTAGWNSAAFRAYLQFHLAEESDMKAVLMQIQTLTHSDSEEEKTAEIFDSAYEPPMEILAEESSSIESTSSTSR